MAGSPRKAERRARFEAWVADPEEAMDELVEWMAEMGDLGHLMGFCKVKDIPYSSAGEWIDADKDRAVAYARAREARIEAMATESLAIVDEAPSTNPITGAIDSADVAHKKLRADHRRWLLSKLAPKRYGDKLDIDANVKIDAVGELREFLTNSRLPIKGA